jgi:6-phosphogluconate dehydrogenase
MQSDIGLIGLAVMGQNLALNIADHGFAISVYNRTTAKTDEFVKENPKTPGKLTGCPTIKDFAASLKKPRKAVILVKAGAPTDAVINELAAAFEPGDIIIDGGNALWTDTIRREKELKAKGLRFIGSGVSGGEEGARFGPSLMPGGDAAAWAELKPIWEAVASKVDAVTGVELTGATPGKPIKGGVPCVAHIGPDGAGHYVKMVHNGIEYGDMQMICEAYDLMRGLLGMTPDEIGTTFEEWNKGDLNSFLIEITAKVLKQKDPETGVPLVDVILDTAGQKGTGKWTSANALDMGVAAPTIAEAVFARCLSAVKDERVAAAKALRGPKRAMTNPDAPRSSNRFATPSTAPRFAPTPKASSSCARRRTSTSGSLTSARSPRSGAAVASSAPASSRRSPRPSARSRAWLTFSSTRTSKRPSRRPRRTGARSSPSR